MSPGWPKLEEGRLHLDRLLNYLWKCCFKKCGEEAFHHQLFKQISTSSLWPKQDHHHHLENTAITHTLCHLWLERLFPQMSMTCGKHGCSAKPTGKYDWGAKAKGQNTARTGSMQYLKLSVSSSAGDLWKNHSWPTREAAAASTCSSWWFQWSVTKQMFWFQNLKRKTRQIFIEKLIFTICLIMTLKYTWVSSLHLGITTLMIHTSLPHPTKKQWGKERLSLSKAHKWYSLCHVQRNTQHHNN